MRYALSAGCALMTLLAAPMLCAQEGDAPMPEPGDVLVDEDFEDGMDNWWVEGGEEVCVEDGHLMVKADPPEGSDAPYVATVWCRTPIKGNTKIEFDAHVVSSSTDVNNVNFFFYYSDPSGQPLYETRDDRPEADYGKYHELNGNIITFLNDTRDEADDIPEAQSRARIRIRHCPDFVLLGETFNYHCRAGNTYHVEITKRNDFIEFRVDGRYLLGVRDPNPWDEGLIGLRTFRTVLWWDNIRATAIK